MVERFITLHFSEDETRELIRSLCASLSEDEAHRRRLERLEQRLRTSLKMDEQQARHVNPSLLAQRIAERITEVQEALENEDSTATRADLFEQVAAEIKEMCYGQ